MHMGLEGRVALVTGGGGAIGGAILDLLSAEGAAVAVCDLNADAAEAKAAALRAQGRQAIAAPADVTKRSEVDRALTIATTLGPVDILVNNAGFSRDKYLVKMDEADWDIVHDVVLKGAFHCCRAVLPGMMERKFGRIVNMSSMSYVGTAGQTNYSSAKAGLIGLSAALAREAGRFNVTCNTVAPALVATPRLRARPDFATLEQRSLANTPLPRLATPNDVAAVVLFFCSSMADFISAQVIDVSGGG